MNVKELAEKGSFTVLNIADGGREVGKVFCCDLLSIAMGKAPMGCAWVTVMANINTLAVASLADASVVVLAEGSMLDEAALAKARQQEINVLAVKEPIFDTGLRIMELMNG